MLKQLIEFGKQLTSLTRDVQQSKEMLKTHDMEIKEIRQELRRLTELVQEVRFEQKSDRDNASHERENLLLRLENALLKFERRLPSGDTKGDVE